MWKAAFTGRSETGSLPSRPSSQRKKSSTSSRKPEEESRRSGKSSRGSTYGDEDGTSSYATAPSSRVGEPRTLTESAVRLLDDDEDEGWEDEDRDARSERKSVRSDGKKHRRKSEKERSRSRSRDKHGKRRSSRKDSEVSRGKSRAVDEGDERALPEMGSFSQFPGQYSGGMMGPSGVQEPTMSGALPTPNNQFGLSRADSYGAAADYYQDEGQSVALQPGHRASTPNMLVNTDLHLNAPSAQAQPAEDTGHGSAADFYSGNVSPGPSGDKPGKTSSGKPSKPGRTSSLGTAAAAAAATGIGLGAVATGANSYYQSQNQTSSTTYQQSSSSTSRPASRPSRHNTDPVSSGSATQGTYYGPPPRQGSQSGNTGKQPSHSNAGLYAAGAAAAGLGAYELNKQHQRQSTTSSVSPYGGTGYAQPPYGSQQRPYTNGNMQQPQQFHEHKGPMTRLKDGLLNLISSEEDTIKMEAYTEYIGVCKYCFDPRTSITDAPRRHHYHGPGERDSFEELRRRRSIEKMRRRSGEQLGRTGSTRVDKDSRYYADRKKSSSKTDLLGTGIAVAGVAAGANALFNSDRKDFDDTYSVKSGHREGSAVRRSSRSSSREKRRRSSHGVVGRDGKDEYVTVRTRDGKIEKRRVHRSRSGSRDRMTGVMGAAAGAALGASAISAAGRSRRGRDHSPNGTFVRRKSRSRSSSRGQGSGGIFGGFFSPPQRKRRGSRTQRQKKERGFFSFGNDSEASSDSELAFGASRTDLSLKRKPSTRSTTKRRRSSENIAATVAGIGATAAALAAAQNGHRIGKRTSRPELGPGNGVKKRQIERKQGRQASDDEWEDELPSDVDDGSSVGSDLAFGGENTKLSRQQSRDSIGSQSSGAGGLSAWGWRWGGKDKKKKRRDPQPPPYPQRPETSGFGPAATGIAAGALAGAALNSVARPSREDSTYTSSSSIPQQPLQYVDPRPLSDAGSLPSSRHTSIPGSFDTYENGTVRPSIAPLQQPKPVTPIKPAFTQDTREFEELRPSPRRTQSSPVESNWGRDAALIGAAAVGTAAVIASQGRKPKDVRFGLTEEQERKHEEERRKQQQKADEERRRADRTRALKEEADRYSREQDVLRQRAEENKRKAEEKLERQRAEEEVEAQRKREREREERDAAYERDRQDRQRRERAEAYDREQARISEEIERKKRELNEQQTRDRDSKSSKRRQSVPKEEETSTSSSVPWGAVAAGAAAAGAGVVTLAGRDRDEEKDRSSRGGDRKSRESYVAKEITPPAAAEVRSITDDAFDDPDYFKRQRSHSPAEYARHVDDLARKAADKVKSANTVVEENAAYYNEPAQSQADFFAPEELHRSSSEAKTKAADPLGDNDVQIFNASDVDPRRKFETEWGRTFAKPHEKAPRGVPKLDLITPTPPPDAMSRSRRSSLHNDKSRGETSVGTDGQKSARSRSISWGADQTHVYDVQTPDSHIEKESYIESPDLPAAAGTTAAGVAAAAVAGAALHEIVVEPASPTDEDARRTYRAEDLVREAKEAAGRTKEEDVEVVNDRDAPPFSYRQPFFESVSDIGVGGVGVDSPGAEGAPPVRGFVEGEVTDPTPTTEKVPHIPGGFDDDEEEPKAESRDVTSSFGSQKPNVSTSNSRDVSAAQPPSTGDDAWEPTLSKKDKKKREKAAKRSSTLDDMPTTTEPDTVSSSHNAPTQVEDDLDYYMSKKDKKAREKAIKRSATLDDVTASSAKSDAVSTDRDVSAQPEEEFGLPLSKKDKKKRDKALKRVISEDQVPVTTTDEPAPSVLENLSTKEAEPELESAWEPPLSKKDKKKREKESKKQGFADVAGAVMTTGGVAAVAAAAADEASDSRSSEKDKKSKKSRDVERDIRDIEPVETVQPEAAATPYKVREPSSMPGGWDSEGHDKETDSPTEAVDPFQFQVFDEPAAPAPPQESSSLDRSTSAKELKKSKRDSLKFSEPSVSSPLRSQVPVDDYSGKPSATSDATGPTTNGHSEVSDPMALEAALVATKAADEGTSSRAPDTIIDDRRLSESPRRVSPDDLRSVASDPTGDRYARKPLRDNDTAPYYGEPESYDDARSVAASEPVDPYETAKKAKRRSRREDDDTASVVSSRSRREKDEPSSKDKKSGFFGMFSRKSTDPAPRSEGASLSRRSTRDSKDDDGDDAERRERRKKHRSSEYGDDEDGRSVASESTRKHRTRSEKGEDSRERRSSRYLDEENDTRNGDDSQRQTYGDGYDVPRESSSHRHHRRSRTDEQSDDQEKSFLGMRVEDMPPLPDSPRGSIDSAPQDREQGHGNLDSAGFEIEAASRDHAAAFGLIRPGDGPMEPESRDISRDHAKAFELIHREDDEEPETRVVIRNDAQAFGLVREEEGEHGTSSQSVDASGSRDAGSSDKHLSWSNEVQYLPTLPDSTPSSPTDYFEAGSEQRPAKLQRPTSTTAVPLRFPFGHQPVTPSPRTERAASFGGGLPSTPASPMSAQKTRQGRPASTEIRPLYLVERTRKIPVVEDTLPSLPSSRTTSRASSMVGSDEYESAAEDIGAPERRRDLTIDTSRANTEWQDDDYLDSQQTTPRATHPPDPVYEKPTKQAPQFYTWEDYEQDERMRETAAEPSVPFAARQSSVSADEIGHRDDRKVQRGDDLPPLPASRPESRTDSRQDSDAAKGVLSAAALGGAAVLGYQALTHDNEPTTADAQDSFKRREADLEAEDSIADLRETESSAIRPSVARSSSSKKKNKKGKRVKKGVDLDTDEEAAAPSQPPATSRKLGSFLAEEELLEEGHSSSRAIPEDRPLTAKDTDVDRFIGLEERLEAGGVATDMPKESATFVEDEESRPSNRDMPAVPNASTGMSEFDKQQAGDVVTDDIDTFTDAEDRMEAGNTVSLASNDQTAPQAVTGELTEDSQRPVQPFDREIQSATTSGTDRAVEDDVDTWQPRRKTSKKEKRKQKTAKAQPLEEPSTMRTESAEARPLQESDETKRDIPVASEVIAGGTTDSLPSLAPVISQGSASLSNIFQGAADSQDPDLKASPSTLMSSAEATVHTSLDPAESVASDRLSLSLQDPPTLDSDHTATQELAQPEAFEEETRDVEDNPILQPEPDSWDSTPAPSRKKGKKDKKKRRSQMDVSDGESEPKSVVYSTAAVSKQPETAPTVFDAIPENEIQPEAVPLPENGDIELDNDISSAVVDRGIRPGGASNFVASTIDESLDRPEDIPLPGDLDVDSPMESGEQLEPTEIRTRARGGNLGSAQEAPASRNATDENDHVDTLDVLRGDDMVQQRTTAVSTSGDPAEMQIAVASESRDREISMSDAPSSMDGLADATESGEEGNRDLTDNIADFGLAAETSTQNRNEEAEFTWSAPSKKKGKKGKKAVQPIVQEAAPAEPVEADTSISTDVEAGKTVDDPIDSWAQWPVGKKGKKGKKASMTVESPEETRGVANAQSAPVDTDNTDEAMADSQDGVARPITHDINLGSAAASRDNNLPIEDDIPATSTPGLGAETTTTDHPSLMDTPRVSRGPSIVEPDATMQNGASTTTYVEATRAPHSVEDLRAVDSRSITYPAGEEDTEAEPTAQFPNETEPERIALPAESSAAELDVNSNQADPETLAEEKPFTIDDTRPSTDRECITSGADAPTEADESEFSWPTTSSKKKGKKSKKLKSVSDPSGSEPPEIEAGDEQTILTEPEPGSSRDRETLEQPVEAETTDTWSVPSKTKKGKKGKKSQAAQIASAAMLTAESSDMDAFQDATAKSIADQDTATAAPAAIQEPDASFTPAKEKKGKKSKKGKKATFDWSTPEPLDTEAENSIMTEAGRAPTLDEALSVPLPIDTDVDMLEEESGTLPAGEEASRVAQSFRDTTVHQSQPYDELPRNLDRTTDASNVPLPDDMDLDLPEDDSTTRELATELSNTYNSPRGPNAERTLSGDGQQRDDDFADDITAALAGSGFNAAQFINDPTFQRRTSPPFMVAEADPEESFAAVTKKKKKGKKTKTAPSRDEPALSEPAQDSTRSADLDDTPGQTQTDFDQTLEKSLAGTGFDTSLLQQAATSSNDISSNELTGDNAEFSFSVPKRKKGKKGMKSRGDDLDDSTTNTDDIPQTNTAADLEQDRSLQEDPAESRDVSEGAFSDPTAHFAIAGDREMDVDEMDKAYKTFKKNKKNKKKQKSSGPTNATTDTVPGGLDGETGQAFETTEPLSGNTQDTRRDLHSSGQDFQDASNDSEPVLAAEQRSTSPRPTSHDDRERSDLHARDPSHELPEYVTAAAGLSLAAAAAAGIGHNARGNEDGQRDGLESTSPSAEERSLGRLPNDRSIPGDVQPAWSFAGLQDGGEPLPESPLLGNKAHEIARDSGYQEANSPVLRRTSTNRTSQDSPVVRNAPSHESLRSRRSAEPLHISTDTGHEWDLEVSKDRDMGAVASGTLQPRTPSRDIARTPLESTTKNRASYLFQTTPEILRNLPSPAGSPTPREGTDAAEYFPSTRTSSKRELDTQEAAMDRATFSSPPPSGAMSPRQALDTIPEEQNAQKRALAEPENAQPDNTKAVRRTQTPQAIRARAISPSAMPPLTIPAAAGRSVSNPLSTEEILQRLPWPSVDEESGAVSVDRAPTRKRSRHASADLRSASVMSNRSNVSAGQVRSPEDFRSFSRASNRSSTPTLRRINLSGDLRAASRLGDSGSAVSAGARSSPKTIPFEPPPTPPSNDDEVMDGGASRSVDMSDVYQGVGDAQASQVSPTRPPNMRKRQSMHIMDLESRLDQLAAENQVLHEAQQSRGIASEDYDMDNSRDLQLQEKESEIGRIKAMLEPMQEEISRLNEINSGLTEANRNLVDEGNGRYTELQQEHAHAHEQWQNTSRELEDMQQEHGRLNGGMREIIEAEIASRLVDKNAEIRQLREELDVASEKIRALQVQIQSTRGRDFLTNRDEDYFDGACQKLCQHVQQWVLRFSKMSDKLVCRLSTDLKDEKIEARLDNAILDGSDVDKLLGDRIKRRDVFMSVVMTMVWEYVFTRYLFGMDREQRQKLKTLEKLLSEVGPPRAVSHWRATTLTLLAKRPAFAEQKNMDTEAVSSEIFGLLCALLPPPSSARDQLSASLLKVISIAVDLSVEMRTQRAEYIMLPPLQPEYDTNGDLVRKVHFNASLMNERSGMFSSNEELEESHAVVKIVLFPLVVKKGDETGEGEEEIVVCPAQVLVHNDNGKGKKIVRVQSGAMQIDDDPRHSRQSLLSAQGSTAF